MVFLRHPSETLIRDLLVSIHFGTLCFWDSHLRPSWTICWLVLILGHGVFETPFWGPHQGSVGWYLFWDIVFLRHPSEALIRDLLVGTHFGTWHFWDTPLRPSSGICWLILCYSFWDIVFLRHLSEAIKRDLLVGGFETPHWGFLQGSVG